MDSNLTLDIGFKGQLKLNAQAVPLQEGYLKLGGIAKDSAGLTFGVVASTATATPDQFEAGTASGKNIRGICVFDDAIAQNAPAHPNKYLYDMPAAVLNHGFVFIASWTKTADDAIDPAIGCKVIFKNDTGTIEFVAASTSVPTGWTQLENASVRALDDDNGALIYVD